MKTEAQEKMERLENRTNAEILELAWDEITVLCGGKRRHKKWTMTVPVDADRDSDIIFGEVLQRFSKLNDEVDQLETENERLREAINKALSAESPSVTEIVTDWDTRVARAILSDALKEGDDDNPYYLEMQKRIEELRQERDALKEGGR